MVASDKINIQENTFSISLKNKILENGSPNNQVQLFVYDIAVQDKCADILKSLKEDKRIPNKFDDEQITFNRKRVLELITKISSTNDPTEKGLLIAEAYILVAHYNLGSDLLLKVQEEAAKEVARSKGLIPPTDLNQNIDADQKKLVQLVLNVEKFETKNKKNDETIEESKNKVSSGKLSEEQEAKEIEKAISAAKENSLERKKLLKEIELRLEPIDEKLKNNSVLTEHEKNEMKYFDPLRQKYNIHENIAKIDTSKPHHEIKNAFLSQFNNFKETKLKENGTDTYINNDLDNVKVNIKKEENFVSKDNNANEVIENQFSAKLEFLLLLASNESNVPLKNNDKEVFPKTKTKENDFIEEAKKIGLELSKHSVKTTTGKDDLPPPSSHSNQSLKGNITR